MPDATEKLVRMANQIADFFAPYPDDEAAAGIHEHIAAFWTRGMKDGLLARAQDRTEGLRPRVVLAIERLRASPSPIHKAAAGAEEAGQAASDAG